MTTKLRAQFDGKAFIPLEPVDVPQGGVFDLELRQACEPTEADDRPGSPQAILRAVRQPPHLSQEDREVFERILEEGKIPATSKGVFDEEQG